MGPREKVPHACHGVDRIQSTLKEPSLARLNVRQHDRTTPLLATCQPGDCVADKGVRLLLPVGDRREFLEELLFEHLDPLLRQDPRLASVQQD